ncbi:hypothetical protein EYF80_063552 [Liparis tanakae]|uniref:Uncharacterized protein n=1 Tax=Liparis tanakae TaxID=230148 RepID=A0A4Z2EC47_9TELE|nr:hypothetical protein EYF80_063552 [Liparis tanakae]
MFHFSGKRLIKASRSVNDGVDSWNSSCSSTAGGGGIRILALPKVTDDPSVSNERLPDSRSVSSASRAPLFFSETPPNREHLLYTTFVASPRDFDSGGDRIIRYRQPGRTFPSVASEENLALKQEESSSPSSIPPSLHPPSLHLTLHPLTEEQSHPLACIAWPGLWARPAKL